MAFVTVPTFVDNVAFLTADGNQYIRDNINYLKGQAGAIYLENAVEIAESTVPATPTSGRGRIFVGSASPNNGIASCVDDAGAIYQMLAYATGTFTPTIAGTSTAGTGTYSAQYGAYTRIGNKVDIWLRLTWSAHTGTGNIQVNGLPFASVSGSQAVLTTLPINLTYTGGAPIGYVGSGLSYIQLFTPASATGATSIAMDTSADILISGSYYI